MPILKMMVASMDSEGRRRARRIFERAVEVTGATRAEFIDRECGEDEALKAAVERLLRADADAGNFLQEPRMRVAPVLPFLPPERIGPYRIGKKIGEGGMGMVYKAVRDDEAFRLEVAVKLIVQSRVSEEARRRLQAERQTLAALDHPWIARILDGGTTDEGLAYIVMELVDGQPIDRYCESEQLSTRGRIELFRKVCEAVHYSHQNLVVHCDLKPSNILVSASGEPKLLDFGIAKLLRESNADDRAEPTTVGSRPLTPEYASPEQRLGETISTVSDVYSLGVLLYKLLTGQRPDTAINSHQDPWTNHVVAPSMLAKSSSVAAFRELRGDLDQIILKALRPRVEERFSSVEQLSEDLERYLQGFPVLARRGSLRYRAGKFLRRHRIPAAMAVVSFLALAFFAFNMAMLAGRLAQEQAKLQETVSFFRLFFERAGPWVAQGRNLTLREAVDQNAQLIEERLDDQPEVQVEIAAVLGDIYRELGQPEQALSWSNRALALHGQLAGEDSLAYSRGLIQAGAALRELERFDESEARIRAGLQGLRSRTSAQPTMVVDGLNNLVSLYCFQERFAEVEGDSVLALSLAESELEAAAPEMMVAVANRALVLRKLGHTAEAQEMYERALGLYRKSLGATHPLVATLLLNLSSIQRDQGDFSSARRSLEEVNDQYLQMFGEAHYGRIRPLVGLAHLAKQEQRIDDALAHYREAISVAIAAQASPMFILRPAVKMAELLLASGRCEEGEQLLRDILEHSRPHAEGRWRYAEVEGLLGECLVHREENVEARIFLERSYERLKENSEANPDARRRALERLMVFYEAIGEEAAREQIGLTF